MLTKQYADKNCQGVPLTPSHIPRCSGRAIHSNNPPTFHLGFRSYPSREFIRYIIAQYYIYLMNKNDESTLRQSVRFENIFKGMFHVSKESTLMLKKVKLTVLLSLLTSLTIHAQTGAVGKFVRTEYPSGYLILNNDKTFKFRFHYDSQWDLACGHFEQKGDTLIFSYNSDMFDVNCNDERINMTDTSDYFLTQGVDKRWRPILATVVRDKILTLKTGDIREAETVSLSYHYYRREKKPKERGMKGR